MVDDTQSQASDEFVHPLLHDMLGDRELNEIIQKHSSLEEVKIEIIISQNGQELLALSKKRFSDKCPCGIHTILPCTHSVDASGQAICM